MQDLQREFREYPFHALRRINSEGRLAHCALALLGLTGVGDLRREHNSQHPLVERRSPLLFDQSPSPVTKRVLRFGPRFHFPDRLKGRWTEDLYATGVPLRSRPQTVPVRRPLRVSFLRGGCARIPVEGLARAGRLQRENPRLLQGHQERMLGTARSYRDTTRPNPMLAPVYVHQDLSLKHDEGLVLVRVDVKRRRLASLHPVLDEHERPIRLLRSSLHGPHAPAGEPAALAFSVTPDDRDCCAHRSTPLMRPRRVPLYGTYCTMMDI